MVRADSFSNTKRGGDYAYLKVVRTLFASMALFKGMLLIKVFKSLCGFIIQIT